MLHILEVIDRLLVLVNVWLGLSLLLWGVPILFYISRRIGARAKRRHDDQHRSKFPYRLVAYLFLGLSLLAYGFGWFIVLLFLIISLLAFRAYILQKLPAASVALQNDARPAVLYLRSFDQESIKFVHMANWDKVKYNDLLNYAGDVHLPPLERLLYRFMIAYTTLAADSVLGRFWLPQGDVTFEKYFRGEVMRRIGPFIALGNPIDDLPAEGAYRDYQIDERWKDVFYERVAQCACIFMQWGNSNNLQFELTSILTLRMCQKLFILTPPQADLRDQYAWVRTHFLREKPATWEAFSSVLRDNGYQLPEQPPGIGSVLTFEADGSPLILVQRAVKPAEYILPIQRRLIERNLMQALDQPESVLDPTKKGNLRSVRSLSVALPSERRGSNPTEN